MNVTLTTPTLETERLILRAPHAGDYDVFGEFYKTQRAQYVGGPMQSWQSWRFLSTEIGHWVLRGYGMFIVTRKGSDAPVGLVGHWYPQGWPETEIGWVLFHADDEGQGIALEAAQACVNHAWRVLKWDTIVSYIDPRNAGSIALAERLGASLDPDAEYCTPDEPWGLVYRHPKLEGV